MKTSPNPQLASSASLEGKGQLKFTTGRWSPHHNCSQVATANDTAIRGWDTRTMRSVSAGPDSRPESRPPRPILDSVGSALLGATRPGCCGLGVVGCCTAAFLFRPRLQYTRGCGSEPLSGGLTPPGALQQPQSPMEIRVRLSQQLRPQTVTAGSRAL